ncbi:hypothetical protein DFJ77DRAFT_518397 [Powellomyces hirtus]|nr:hypothetical protein DFJ77DRAFT_518397 [Powellomyces hirtus]
MQGGIQGSKLESVTLSTTTHGREWRGYHSTRTTPVGSLNALNNLSTRSQESILSTWNSRSKELSPRKRGTPTHSSRNLNERKPFVAAEDEARSKIVVVGKQKHKRKKKEVAEPPPLRRTSEPVGEVPKSGELVTVAVADSVEQTNAKRAPVVPEPSIVSTPSLPPARSSTVATLIPIQQLVTSVNSIQGSLREADIALADISRSHQRLAEWRPKWPDFDGIRSSGQTPDHQIRQIDIPPPTIAAEDATLSIASPPDAQQNLQRNKTSNDPMMKLHSGIVLNNGPSTQPEHIVVYELPPDTESPASSAQADQTQADLWAATPQRKTDRNTDGQPEPPVARQQTDGTGKPGDSDNVAGPTTEKTERSDDPRQAQREQTGAERISEARSASLDQSAFTALPTVSTTIETTHGAGGASTSKPQLDVAGNHESRGLQEALVESTSGTFLTRVPTLSGALSERRTTTFLTLDVTDVQITPSSPPHRRQHHQDHERPATSDASSSSSTPHAHQTSLLQQAARRPKTVDISPFKPRRVAFNEDTAISSVPQSANTSHRRLFSPEENILAIRSDNKAQEPPEPYLDSTIAEDANVLTVKWIHHGPPATRAMSSDHSTQFLIPRVKEYIPDDTHNNDDLRWPSPTPSTPQPWDDDYYTTRKLEYYDMLAQRPRTPLEESDPDDNRGADHTLAGAAGTVDATDQWADMAIKYRPSTSYVRPTRGVPALAWVQSKIGKNGEKDLKSQPPRPRTWSSPAGRNETTIRQPLRSQMFEMRGCPNAELIRPPVRPHSSLRDVNSTQNTRPSTQQSQQLRDNNNNNISHNRPTSKEEPKRCTSAAVVSQLIREAVTSISYKSSLSSLPRRSGGGGGCHIPGTWSCADYEPLLAPPVRHEISVVDVNQQYDHLWDTSLSATGPSTAEALTDLVWAHRIVPTPDPHLDRDVLIKLAANTVASVISQTNEGGISDGRTARTPGMDSESGKNLIPHGAEGPGLDSLCVKIPRIVETQVETKPASPPVPPLTLPPPQPPLLPVMLEAPKEAASPLSPPPVAPSETKPDITTPKKDRKTPALSPAPPKPGPPPPPSTAPTTNSVPNTFYIAHQSQPAVINTTAAPPIPRPPVSVWSLQNRVPLHSALRTQPKHTSIAGAIDKLMGIAMKERGCDRNALSAIYAEIAELRMGFENSGGGESPEPIYPRSPPPPNPTIRRVVPTPIEVNDTDPRPATPEPTSNRLLSADRPGTRLPSANHRTLTLTAISHGWRTNDGGKVSPEYLGDTDELDAEFVGRYAGSRAASPINVIRDTIKENAPRLPELLTEGWFVQNIRRDELLGKQQQQQQQQAVSEDEKLPSIVSPSVKPPSPPPPSADHPDADPTTCESGPDDESASKQPPDPSNLTTTTTTPKKATKTRRKKRRAKSAKRKSQRELSASRRSSAFTTDAYTCGDELGDSGDVDGSGATATRPTSGRISSIASRRTSSMHPEEADNMDDTVVPIDQEVVAVLPQRPSGEVDAAARSMLRYHKIVELMQRKMRAHRQRVQYRLYMDMIYLVQRMYRGKRVRAQYLRILQLKRTSRNATLAMRQMERVDDAAHIRSVGATTREPPIRSASSTPTSSTEDLLAYKTSLNPVLHRVKTVTRRRLNAAAAMAAMLSNPNEEVMARLAQWEEYVARYEVVKATWPSWVNLLVKAGDGGMTVGAPLEGEEGFAFPRAPTPPPPVEIVKELSPNISYSMLPGPTSTSAKRTSIVSAGSKRSSIARASSAAAAGAPSTTRDGKRTGSRSTPASASSTRRTKDQELSSNNTTTIERKTSLRSAPMKSSRRASFAMSVTADPACPTPGSGVVKSAGSRRVSYAAGLGGGDGGRLSIGGADRPGSSRRVSIANSLLNRDGVVADQLVDMCSPKRLTLDAALRALKDANIAGGSKLFAILAGKDER